MARCLYSQPLRWIYIVRTKIQNFHDAAFAHFAATYPAARRMTTTRARHAFVRALGKVPVETLLAAVAQHKRSAQWQQHVIPSMVKWLEEERWIQTLPEPAPTLSPADQAQRWRSLSPQAQLRRIK
jgi:hypothetical protein